MDKMKIFAKKNYKVVISFILGMVVCIGIGVSAVATKDITYDNTTSGLTSTNLQGAIDELNEKAINAEKKCLDGKICNDAIAISNPNSNIIKAYTYNQTKDSNNYCITGEESTCKETNCINYSNRDSCLSGTIIKYKVNDTEEKYFYVLHDDGITMTLQQRESIINYYIHWWYESKDGTFYADNTYGPTYLLRALEEDTAGWTNVNDQTYVMGITNFNNTNAYTGCSSYNNCTTNTYTMEQRTGKARAITVQEAVAVGCTESSKSCPIWMYNYLNGSTSNGGTIDDEGTGCNYAYWIMNAVASSKGAWVIPNSGLLYPFHSTHDGSDIGARAVVVINK